MVRVNRIQAFLDCLDLHAQFSGNYWEIGCGYFGSSTRQCGALLLATREPSDEDAVDGMLRICLMYVYGTRPTQNLANIRMRLHNSTNARILIVFHSSQHLCFIVLILVRTQ